jgi:DNA repair protein RadC
MTQIFMGARTKQSNEKFRNPAGHRKRLRERFLKSSPAALADYELLELLLTYTIPRTDTKPLAKALLQEFGGLGNILKQPDERLLKIEGVGPNVVLLLRVIRSCLERSLQKEVEEKKNISGPEDLVDFVRMSLGSRPQECLYALYLDESRHIVYQAEVATGTINKIPFYPREILKPALAYNATSVILIHNHPEGQPIPSDADLAMTRKLEEVAALLDIRLLDHLIVTAHCAYSIKTGKLL